MAESIVSDWLAEYAALEPTEMQTFVADHEHNHEVSSALFTIINERLKYPDVSSLCDPLRVAQDIGTKLAARDFRKNGMVEAVNSSGKM